MNLGNNSCINSTLYAAHTHTYTGGSQLFNNNCTAHRCRTALPNNLGHENTHPWWWWWWWGGGGCSKIFLEIMRLQTGSISVADQPSTYHLPNTFHSSFLLICSLSSSSSCLVRSFCSPFRALTPFQFLISAFLSIAYLFLCSHCRQFQCAIADLTTASDSSFFLG